MRRNIINHMATKNFALKRELSNQKMMTFFACLGFAGYTSIDNHTAWPLILFFGVYAFLKLKGKYHEKT